MRPWPTRAGAAAERPPGEPRRVAYLYLLPALAVFALFVLAPLAHSVWLSLFEWDGVTPGTWVGLGNYGQVVSDPQAPDERWVYKRETCRGCGAPVVQEQVGGRTSYRCSAEQGP